MDSTWRAVDEYFENRLGLGDPALSAALADSTAAGRPPINVTAAEGKLLALLAESIRARRILEIGTLGGYSTIWMARALPADGRLVTLEIDSRHAAVAQRNVARAGVADRVSILVAPASDSLKAMIAEGVESFDLVFIDADKERSLDYFEASLELSRPGSLIVVDNVVRKGAVVEKTSSDTMVQGVRRLIDRLAGDTRVSATAIQTVGGKGYDGFLLARVNTPTGNRES
jgi:predicted O-methyltransferase YrrM